MPKEEMKVLLLASYYMPNLGYQENGWARALSKYGVRTKVVAPAYSYSCFKSIIKGHQEQAGTIEIDGYELQYLPYYWKFRAMTWPRGIKAVIRDFEPDVVVAPGIGALFPAAGAWYKDVFGYKLICLFGDNAMQRPRNYETGKPTLKGKILEIAYRLFKGPLYIRAFEKADTIGYNTDPATKEVLTRFLGFSRRHLAEKMISLPLGYEGDVFYYSPELRTEKRAQLGFKDDDCVFVYASRVQPRRRIESLLQSIKLIMRDNPRVKLMIVGFLGDYYERRLKDYIAELDFGDSVVCLPLADRHELNALFNAADIGVWHLLPTITLVEATGTGLPIVVPDDPSFSPGTFPSENIEVFKFGEKEGLELAFRNMMARMANLPDRAVRAKLAENREYKQIVARAMKSVGIVLGEQQESS